MGTSRRVDPYGGDLIFITGAPGSKWSPIAHAISYADQINNSDVSHDRIFDYSDAAISPIHFGNYFGPGMEFGDNFHELERVDKDQLLDELHRPFTEPGGLKLVKSHLFSQHLERLRSLFPRARFIMVHRPDQECLEWWLEIGGFDISFPDYSWYRDLENMRTEIRAENEGILRFVASAGLELRRLRSFGRLFEGLGLTLSDERVRDLGSSDAEVEHGLGGGSVADIKARIHSQARLARLAWCGPAPD